MIPSNSVEKIFSFASLPYVCQRRFAEICDGRTLRTFASLNDSTRNLSKRCHWIKEVMIGIPNGSIEYYIKCLCSPTEHCRGIDISQFNGKLDVLDVVKLQYPRDQNESDASADDHFFERLPVSLSSLENLFILADSIKFSVLKTLWNPILKVLEFQGDVIFDCALTDFVDFIKLLSKTLDEFQLRIFGTQKYFAMSECASQFSSLQHREIVDKFSISEYQMVIEKYFQFY